MKRTGLLSLLVGIMIFLIVPGMASAQPSSGIPGNLIPEMTSNTAPSGRARASAELYWNGNTYSAWRAFNTNAGLSFATPANQRTGWLSYEFPNPTVVNKYYVRTNPGSYSITSWTFQASLDGTNWVDLHYSNSMSEIRAGTAYRIDNQTAYSYYRIVSHGSTDDHFEIHRLEMFRDLDAPTGLTGQVGDSEVYLTWNPVEGAESYNVYRDGERVNPEPVTSTQYTDSGLTGDESYTFTVTAIDANSIESPHSEPFNVTVVDTAPVKPINFTAAPGDRQVTLTWTANTESDLAGYKVYRGGVHLQTIGKAATSFVVTGLENGVKYEFRLVAYDQLKNESEPAIVQATPKDSTPPAAPENLVATPGNKVINLMWTMGSEPDLKGYYIYLDGVRVSGQPTKDIYRSLTGLINGRLYAVEVSAVDNSGNESPRSAATATPDINADSTPPVTPADLQATANRDKITVTWTANEEPDLVGYFVYRDGERVNYTPISTNGLTLHNLPLGKTYKIAVSAIDNSGNESPISDPVDVYVDIVQPPVNLRAQEKFEPPEDAGIHLIWEAPSPTPEKYLVIRNGIQVAEVEAPPFHDGTVEMGNGYTYEVKAYRDGLESTPQRVRVFYSDRDVEFGSEYGLGPVMDVIKTGLSFLSKYWLYLTVILGVMFAPTIISIPRWLFQFFTGQKVNVVTGQKQGKKAAGEGRKAGAAPARKGNTVDRRYDRLMAEGRKEEAQALRDRADAMKRRHERDVREMREYEKRNGKRQAAREDMRLRHREERQAFNREIVDTNRNERAARAGTTAGRQQRSSRGGRGPRNGRR